MNLEMLGEGGTGPRDSLMKQQRVLMNKAERNKLGEAAGLLLDVAQQSAAG